MTTLDLLGLFACTLMMFCYAFEHKHVNMTLAFSVSCVAASSYGFAQGAWPFGIVEFIWSIVAMKKYFKIKEMWRREALLTAALFPHRSNRDNAGAS